MAARLFKERQIVKRADTGEQVQVIEILPVGQRVFYRIEYDNGDRGLVIDGTLRAVQSVAQPARGRI